MHYFEIDDEKGDLIDLVPFCSDWCHTQWCRENNLPYNGWNGCHENEHNEQCRYCGAQLPGTLNE